jgi:hypothetical protein
MIEIRRIQYGGQTGGTWRDKLALAAGGLIALAAAVLVVAFAVGFAIVLLPVVAVGVAVAAWRFRKWRRAAMAERTAYAEDGERIIETDYSVIDEDRH